MVFLYVDDEELMEEVTKKLKNPVKDFVKGDCEC